MIVYVVTAEANGVPQTTDGMWFHILGVFKSESQAMAFQQKVCESGEWGDYVVMENGVVSTCPTEDSHWQVNLYDEDVQESMIEVPPGYNHYSVQYNRLATPAARMIRKQLLNGCVMVSTIPDYVLRAMKERNWLMESSSTHVELFPQARAACADETITD